MLMLLVSVASVCLAQSTEKITNANIVGMAKAGLPQSVIIKTIESSDAKFDVSANAMILLKKQGVTNDVIAAMVEKTKGSSLPVKSSNPVSKLPSLDLINQLYTYQKTTGSVTPLEKTFAAMKAKTKFLGYGGASVVLTVDGEKSPVRIADTASTFIIHTSGISPSDFALYKLTVEKKKRQAIMQKINSGFKGFGSTATEAGSTLPFNVTQLKEGIFQLTPTTPLLKGEYFFAAKTQGGGGTVDVYAFGVDY